MKNIANRVKFFHWELEFPDVFIHKESGFDLILGNPPWEIMKPHSKEFFSRFDPVYITYAKQEALRHQTELFKQNPEIETEWTLYNDFYSTNNLILKLSLFQKIVSCFYPQHILQSTLCSPKCVL